MKTVLYTASLDPITYGHIDIIQRTLKVFDKVVVGIGINPKKNYTFTLEEKEYIAKQALKSFGDRVEVTSFTGLAVNYAHEQCLNPIIRGLRNMTDFEFEKMLNDVNKTQNYNIDTYFIVADPKLSAVSSSAVKEIIKNYGDATEYVPLCVKEILEQKLLGQTLIGITGEIGAGKSYVTQKLIDYCESLGIQAYNIDLDQIGHELLTKDIRPIAKKIRDEICKYWAIGNGIHNFIDIKKLGSIIFSDKVSLKIFNQITSNEIIFKVRQALIGKKGIMFINSALLMEANLSPLVNNNIVFVDASYDTRYKRLEERSYSDNHIKARMSSQWNIEKKIEVYKKAVEKYNKGTSIQIHNDESSTLDQLILFKDFFLTKDEFRTRTIL